MKEGSLSEFRAVAKKNFFRGVLDHCFTDHVFLFETIVYFTVVIYRLRGEKCDVGMEIADHFFGVMPDEYGTVEFLNTAARRICGNIVFCKKRKGIDTVRNHADILEFGKIFRYKESGRGAVKKNQIAVFNELDRRQSHFFLLEAIDMHAERKAGEEIVVVVQLRAAVRARHKSFPLQNV